MSEEKANQKVTKFYEDNVSDKVTEKCFLHLPHKY